MTESIVVTGIILSAQPIGEYDRRVVLLTSELGKISAFAKGARRPTASLLGCTQPFVFGCFSLFAGKSSYTFQSAEVKNYFSELREDLPAVSYGFYFCEFAEAVTREGMPAKEELKVLYRSLSALKKDAIGKPLVRVIFEYKMLAVGGVSPQVFECIRCRKKDELIWFSAKGGGCICKSCRKLRHVHLEEESPNGETVEHWRTEPVEKLFPLLPSSLYTLQYMQTTPIERLYTFTVSDEVLTELKQILEEFILVHIGKEFKSLPLLTQLTSF